MSRVPTGDAAQGSQHRLLPDEPVIGLDEYVAGGGGQALAAALRMSPQAVVGLVDESGLRGRGGAGFPTGTKWRSVRDAANEVGGRPQLVVNGAEGEPGTYKDRRLIADHPLLVVEGTLIAMHALGASEAHIGVKQASQQGPVLRRAIDQVVRAGWADVETLRVVEGPDEYLFGEETGLLEVIEGGLPLPRWLPPFQQGLFATTADPRPTAVNNVETLANLPFIVTQGAEKFRTVGTPKSPGTMLFTVVGDVASPGVYELPLGTPLRTLLVDIAGARDIKAVLPGASGAVIVPEMLDTPLAYETMTAAGTSLGSGGLIVYDERHCMVRVAQTMSNFLAIESCGQCTACKVGCTTITDLLDTIERGDGEERHLAAISDRLPRITDQTRCALPAGEQLVVGSLLERFRDEFTAHLGTTCTSTVAEQVPKITMLDDHTGDASFDPTYHRKREDWSYTPETP